MRKFAKITLITSVCAIVVGGVLCVTSFATGGIKNVTFDKGVDVYDNSKYNIDKKELEAFDSFDINADAVNVEFVEGDSYAFEYHGNSKPTYSVSNGKLNFNIEKEKKGVKIHIGEFISRGLKNNRLIIYTPDSAKFKDGKVEADAGNITLNSLIADKITLEADAGNINVNESEISECEISADAGNIKADGSSLRKLTVETSAGNVKLTDISTDDADIMSDMGNIKAEINGSRNEYDLNIDNDMGNVKVDGKKVHELEEKTGKDKKLSIENNMGNININFN